MACLPSDDILGSTGESVLLTLTIATTLEDVAQQTGLPLFRVRGTVRRLLEAGLTNQVGQMFEITPAGIETLEQKGKKPDIDDISLNLWTFVQNIHNYERWYDLAIALYLHLILSMAITQEES